jgi:bifunctional DNA-binding transcriptional regulator/antitoxin component of YhaV-PrlF toxin-antitoxin module
MNRAGKRSAYSKVLAGGRITLPRGVREALGVVAGDVVCFSLADGTAVIRKACPAAMNDPFVSFAEWSSQADDRAYEEL